LNNDWIPILGADADAAAKPGNAFDDSYTPADLDSIAAEYRKRGMSQKAPLSLGLPDEHTEAHGQVAELRRNGNQLQARFSNVDPNLAHLWDRGLFPEKVVSVKRSPEGLSLKRVGLLHPYGNPGMRTGTPSLDTLMKTASDPKDTIFSQAERQPNYGNGYTEFTREFSEGERVRGSSVVRLKSQGRWLAFYDEFGVPLLFEQLEKNPAKMEFGEGVDRQECTLAEWLSSFLARGWPAWESADLDREAKKIARSRDVSYGEALTIANGNRVKQQINAKFAEGGSRGCAGVELHFEAQRLSEERNLSYSDALSRVVTERPELTGR
jgi:hypothetical protein